MDLFLTLIVLCSSLFIIVLLRRFSSWRRRHLPPGSLGLPVVGETLQLISAYKSENPERFIDDRVGRFGSVFTTHVFGEATVFSADPETNRFVLQNEGKLFESSYPSSIENLLGRHSLLIMKGGLHKRLHSLTMSFANSYIIRNHLLADIDRLVRFNLDFWSGRVLLMERAKKITFELAVKQLMSFDPGEWTESLRKEYVLVMEGFFTVPFFSITYHRALKARKKVAEALTLVVRERRSKQREVARDQGGENEWKQDMLEALLNLDDGLSDEEVVDFLVAMLVAGFETTSTIMTLAVKFLTDHTAALAQLKEEHDQTRARKGQSEALEWNDYRSMSFTQCVVNETLRYANIISGVFRRTTTEVRIKGYIIPKDWKLFASFRAVHLDPQHFNNARSFDPWRWQNTNSGSGGQNGNVFAPFGGGPRLCPGHELARVELTVFLYHLITRFSWDPAEEDKLVFFPTTRALKRYPINVKHRRQPLVSGQQAL